MSRIVVIEYVSLDGVIQGPGHAGEDTDGGFGQGGWSGPLMAEHSRYLSGQFAAAGGFLLGRRTYDIWAPYWPTATGPIAAALNGKPKYVASRTQLSRPWDGTTVVNDVPGTMTRLRDQPGAPVLVMGSSALVHTLTEHKLVDEYQLWLHPVVLGGGKKLFADGGPSLSLRLVSTAVTAGGMVILTYEP